MNNSLVLHNVKDIDLSRHGVIEAHAGTGKTYTIVQMVLRILQEKDNKGARIHIREILLVTFTEKAAGELKKRIREGIEKRLAEMRKDGAPDDYLAAHLEGCLNNLHEALIGTIHSVCLRLLQTWPFETGIHFTTEIVDDNEGLDGALRESMRADWQDVKTGIPSALEQLERQGNRLEQKYIVLICRTAGLLLDEEYAVIDRSATPGRPLKKICEDCIRNSEELENSKVGFKDKVTSFIGKLERVRDSGKMEPERLELLEKRLSDLKRTLELDRFELKILLNPCRVGKSQIYTKPDLKKIPELADVDEFSRQVSGHVFLTAMQRSEELTSQLIITLVCDAAEILSRRWNRTKSEKGLISYQDMLRLMHRAVNSNSEFLNSLRGRLRFGIIDEFQDTSIMQWKIFEKIFLPAGGLRIFIVGDPKQSIYAFQGADVASYLDARSIILDNDGRIYYLDRNFRSLKEIIDGYNSVLSPDETSGDWFAFETDKRESISYPSAGEAGGLARPPVRKAHPANALKAPALQVVPLEGNAGRRLKEMAKSASGAIQSLRGAVISIPGGEMWKDLQVEYRDFAVIAETHRMAEAFLRQLQTDGIPAVKYKMEGVFQSPMARDLHAILRVILNRGENPAFRLAALLTHFFNRRAEDIDLEHDLEECPAGDGCSGDDACIAHALQEWICLADRFQWAVLFRRIQERTGIRRRLILLADGERRLADLRQIIDYCIEKLYRDNFGLRQLIEHLGRLNAEEERVGQDRNLHVLATEKSSVKVLTVHAAKGLEFPVVFAAAGASKGVEKGPAVLLWMEKTKKEGMERHVKHVTPYVSSEALKEADSGRGTIYDIGKLKITQERRRLLYVALTRPQAHLFVPMHLKEIIEEDDGRVIYSNCSLPAGGKDDDLTPRLQKLVDKKALSLFDIDSLKSGAAGTDSADKPASVQKSADLARIPDIDIGPMICVQTSYSQLSRSISSQDRSVDRSEEDDEPEAEAAEGAAQERPVLPGGRKTGDALHLALEEILQKENINDILGDDNSVMEIARKYMDRNGILKGMKDRFRDEAVNFAAVCIKNTLSAAIGLPDGSTINIAGLEKRERIPEMEFLLSAGPHWIHGYMDLVFRVKNSAAKHPWRYFILDWKSDRLEGYGRESVEMCVKERHYDLQAKIYCRALDEHLSGLIGDDYEPEKNLGGAVYVFLRGYADIELDDTAASWRYHAVPDKDKKFVSGLLEQSGASLTG